MRELPLEELIGSLMTYEMKIAIKKKKKKEMLEAEGKKKSIALKAQEEKVVGETKINDLEKDIALITKRVQKLMMKDKFSRRTYNRRSNYKIKRSFKRRKKNEVKK